MSIHNYEYKHSKYELGIIELYWETRHGEYIIDDFKNIEDYNLSINGYIFMQRIHPIQFLKYYKKYITPLLKYYYQNMFIHHLTTPINHQSIQNFENIISNEKNYRVDIVQKIQLEGDFAPTIAIVKTHYLRLIQRKWKNIFKKRQDIIKKRMTLQSLRYREINGIWPIECSQLPTIMSH
jgi:hypothetical protein